MPLLQLLARLRTLRQADPATLRDRASAALRAFEDRATAAGHPPDLVRRTQYALADSLDEAVLNTPWGAGSAWATTGMVATFHPTVGSGRFFDALKQAEAKVDTMRPALEVMATCLSLGTAGPYRDRPGGQAELEGRRKATFAVLAATAPTVPPPLSARWEGEEAPFRRGRARLPVWVAATLALAAGAGLFLALALRTSDAGDAAYAQMLSAPPARMPALSRGALPPPPAPPPPPEPTRQDRLRAALAPAVSAGTVTVGGLPGSPVLRVPEAALFPVNGAKLLPDSAPLVGALAAALRAEAAGPVRVLGYLDDRPVRTVPFPSSFKLTAARAEALRAALLPGLGVAVPVAAEGRAGADPVAPNTTPDGREQNRRMEIVLDGVVP